MIQAGKIIKDLRIKSRLSQRCLAGISGMSARQIQRIENHKSDITMNKFCNILDKAGFDIRIVPKEPDWNILYNFGLPVNIPDKAMMKYEYKLVKYNIHLAANFLLENQSGFYLRYFDAFKAILLALKTHYPARFRNIQDEDNLDLTEAFDLKNVRGKHIKLRNICLYNISLYFHG